MDTSRPRTPPGPVSAGPRKGARSACRGKQKTSKSPFGFRNREFFRSAPAPEIIQLGLASHRRFTKWIDRSCFVSMAALDGVNREAGIGSGSEMRGGCKQCYWKAPKSESWSG